MYKKIVCLLLLFSFGVSASADAIVKRNYPYNRTAIQSSSIVNSNADYDYNSLNAAIKEIQNKIKTNSNDYILYVSLIELYIKTKQYDKAHEELIFINNLSKQNKLNSTVKSYISSVYENCKKNGRYERNKAALYINLAMFALVLNDNVQAEEYISAAADLAADNKMLESAAAIIFDSMQMPDKAVAVCDKILTKNPKALNIRKLKASYLVQQKNTEAAIAEYTKIIQADSEDIDSKYHLYRLLEAKKLSEKDIIKYFYNPDKDTLDEVYYKLADMLLKKDDIDSARAFANTLVNKFPDNAEGYILLSEIYRKEGRLKESYEALSKVRDRADNNEAIAKYNVILAKLSDEPVREANSLISTGLYQQALDVLDSANQESLYVILTQARANYFLDNKYKTLELLNKSMSLYPDNSDVYCAFGYIYLKEKDIESARKYVNKSLKLNPQNKTASDLLDMVNKAESDKYMNSIVNSFDSQNYQEAMRLIDEALAVNKKEPVLYYYKALTYIAQNNYAASTASLYKCIELDKNNALAYFYLGIAFDNLSEPKNALSYYQQFINLLPADELGESERLNYAKVRIQKLKG